MNQLPATIDSCCRICGTADYGNVRNIFDVVMLLHDEKRIVDMLEYCLQQTIDTSSNLFPNAICSGCIATLITTYEFFEMYRKTEAQFIEMHRQCVNVSQNATTAANIKVEQILIKTEKIDLTADYMDPINMEEIGDTILGPCNLIEKVEDTMFATNDIKVDGPEKAINLAPDDEDADEDTYMEIIINENGIQRYVCKICRMDFLQKNFLQIHREKTHLMELRHRCEKCGRLFRSKKKLLDHFQSHIHEKSERKYMCDICNMRFFKMVLLRMHMRKHSGEKPFKCTFKNCERAFSQRGAMKTHVRLIHEKMKQTNQNPTNGRKEIKYVNLLLIYDCSDCNRRFSSKSSLLRHRLKHNAEDKHKYSQRKYVCETCNKRFVEEQALTKHQRIHTNQRPYTCDACSRSFRERSSYRTHVKRCAPHLLKSRTEGPFKCTHCDRSYATAMSLHEHRKANSLPIHECEYCNGPFSKRIELHKHVKQFHGNDLKTYQCDICLDSFSMFSSLSLHMDKHKYTKDFLCVICGKAFQTASQLNVHQRTHDFAKPFACNQCTSAYKSKKSLELHKQTVHLQQKKWFCEICRSFYSSPASLRIHNLKHNGIRSFVCENSGCNKSFFTKGKLRVHERIHTGEKPYKCTFEQCQRAFTQKGDMTKHMLIHLGPTPHKCTECGASFRLETELRRHSYSHYKPAEN